VEVAHVKALIALDNSPDSWRAVEYSASIFPRLPDSEVHLLSLTPGIPPGSRQFDPASPPPEVHGDEDHQQEFQKLRGTLQAAADLLIQNGMAAGRIRQSILPVSISLGQDIVDEAGKRGCDTIVVGRRGLSLTRKLLLGSVSSEVVHKAAGLTVWVVE
jgi:nucleotide-binding universal stress UspA family protein